jgi:protein-S-isoprenylcysteine O-methyltransferase Ste14
MLWKPKSQGPQVLFFPPLLFACLLGVAIGLEGAAPLGVLAPMGFSATGVVGAVLCAAALGLAVWAMVSFRKAGTHIEPIKPALNLVVSGPYRITRNPMYVGLVTLMLGLSLAASLDWGVLLVPVLWALLHWGVVLKEEAYLTDTFGAPYLDFLSRTRRWL